MTELDAIPCNNIVMDTVFKLMLVELICFVRALLKHTCSWRCSTSDKELEVILCNDIAADSISQLVLVRVESA